MHASNGGRSQFSRALSEHIVQRGSALSPELPTEHLHQTLLVGIEHVCIGSTQTSHEVPELANAGQALCTAES